MTSVSVVIPNYRRPALLRRCLESVMSARATSSHAVEVVVVDDGSEDESCAIVSSEFPDARLVALERNLGYAGAVNAGVSVTRGEWVLTLNNDTTVEPELFDQLLTVAGSAPEIGIVAAQQRFTSDPGRIYSAGMQLDARGHASDRLMGMPVRSSECEPIEVFGACGAAALYRRSLLEQLEGFDERFTFGLEDADLAWRARMRGWRCMYAPAAIVYHDLGGTLAHGTDRRLFLAGRNRWLLIAKNLDRRQLLRHLVSIVSFDVGYVAFGCVRLRSLAPLRGRVAGLREWRAARADGAAGRIAVPLAPAAPLREALARRRAWRHAGRPARAAHVLVLNQYAPPDPASTGAFAYEVAAALVGEGLRVTFLAGQPSYVAEQGRAPRREYLGGVRIMRLRILRRGGRTSRAWRFGGYLSYLARAAVTGGRLIFTERIDTILAFHNPPLLKLLAAALAGRRRKLVCVLLDLHPDVLLATRWIRLPRVAVKMWEAANRWALGRAARVVVLSHGMRDVLVEKGVERAKVEVVPLWARPELTPTGRPRSAGELKLLFAGNLGITQQLAPVRDAAAALVGEPVHFCFVGNDAPRAQLAGLPNVSFIPFQSEAEYRALVCSADAGIVTLALGLERLVVPSRALPFLSAGVPLLAVMNPESELGHLIGDYGCGACVMSADDVVGAVKQWLREPDALRVAGARAREAYEATRDRRQLPIGMSNCAAESCPSMHGLRGRTSVRSGWRPPLSCRCTV